MWRREEKVIVNFQTICYISYWRDEVKKDRFFAKIEFIKAQDAFVNDTEKEYQFILPVHEIEADNSKDMYLKVEDFLKKKLGENYVKEKL